MKTANGMPMAKDEVKGDAPRRANDKSGGAGMLKPPRAGRVASMRKGKGHTIAGTKLLTGSTPGRAVTMRPRIGSTPEVIVTIPRRIGIMPEGTGTIRPPIGIMPGGIVAIRRRTGITPEVTGTIRPPIGIMPEGIVAIRRRTGIMPEVTGTIRPPIGIMPARIVVMRPRTGTMPHMATITARSGMHVGIMARRQCTPPALGMAAVATVSTARIRVTAIAAAGANDKAQRRSATGRGASGHLPLCLGCFIEIAS